MYTLTVAGVATASANTVARRSRPILSAAACTGNLGVETRRVCLWLRVCDLSRCLMRVANAVEAHNGGVADHGIHEERDLLYRVPQLKPANELAFNKWRCRSYVRSDLPYSPATDSGYPAGRKRS